MPDKFYIVKKGYDPIAVDEHIKRCDEYMSHLEETIKEYKLKIKTLEDRLNTYITKEAAINNAIINSQISADNMLLNAKNAAETIVQNAKKQGQATEDAVDKRIYDVMRSVAFQKQYLQETRQEYDKVIIGFREMYDNIIRKFLHTSDDGMFRLVDDKIEALENFLKRLHDEVDDDADDEDEE
ncbi:MAG: DivIVA domain-containing protein [Defluviitaleaceae bacterium]|nr:DivIVA domain-containing protein [Defluviitaleaceae bacterium]